MKLLLLMHPFCNFDQIKVNIISKPTKNKVSMANFWNSRPADIQISTYLIEFAWKNLAWQQYTVYQRKMITDQYFV